jgi:FkbM family methyltransferase
MGLKSIIRSGLNFLHLDLTKNLEYDRLTKLVIKKVLNSDSNAVDIGCHKGEILADILKYAPQGMHYGFEPIPSFYNDLKLEFKNRATIYPYALSDKSGDTIFNYVKNAPAYSGINKRKYAIDNPEIEEIKVELKKLDDLITEDIKIKFIKIDVEGAELGVLRGAKEILKRDKPLVIFECGLGASDYYNTDPNDIYELLVSEVGLNIYTIKGWLDNSNSLSNTDFLKCYKTNCEYYFIAN